MKKPPPDEATLRNALLGILKERGLEPEKSWVCVRLLKAPGSWAGMYVVAITYPTARTELAGTLRGITGSRAEKEGVGVWVLDKSEARELCKWRVRFGC